MNERTFKDEYKAWEWYPQKHISGIFWKYFKTACMKNLTGFLSTSYQLVTHIYENIPEPWDKQWPLWEMESKLHWIHKEKTLSPTHKCFQTERDRRGQGNTQNDNTKTWLKFLLSDGEHQEDVMFTLDDDEMCAQ